MAGEQDTTSPQSVDGSPLDAYRGTHRPVLVFAPSERAPEYQQQLRWLAAHGDALAERDVVVLEVRGEAEGTLDGRPLPEDALRALRTEHYANPQAFLVVLMGKDGAEKFRSNAPTPVERLCGLIDATPRRPVEPLRHEEPLQPAEPLQSAEQDETPTP
jgi:Domain of unknown function (DUF4174)